MNRQPPSDNLTPAALRLAKAFHEEFQAVTIELGLDSLPPISWEDLDVDNKDTLLVVFCNLLRKGVVREG